MVVCIVRWSIHSLSTRIQPQVYSIGSVAPGLGVNKACFPGPGGPQVFRLNRNGTSMRRKQQCSRGRQAVIVEAASRRFDQRGETPRLRTAPHLRMLNTYAYEARESRCVAPAGFQLHPINPMCRRCRLDCGASHCGRQYIHRERTQRTHRKK